MHTCISSHRLKRSWRSCPRQVNAGNKNTPSTHHPRRQNVTTVMGNAEEEEERLACDWIFISFSISLLLSFTHMCTLTSYMQKHTASPPPHTHTHIHTHVSTRCAVCRLCDFSRADEIKECDFHLQHWCLQSRIKPAACQVILPNYLPVSFVSFNSKLPSVSGGDFNLQNPFL